MKTIKKTIPPSYKSNKAAPEIRDNLDSRKNEEQDYKGEDTTHNQKPHQNKKASFKKKDHTA